MRVSPPFLHEPVARPPHRRLQAGEGEVAPRPVEERTRQGEADRVALARRRLDGGPARWTEPEELRDLVEGLARGVVDRPPEAPEALGPLHRQELAMTARDQQHEVREGNLVGQPRGERVSGEVVDAIERQAAAGGESLGEHDAGKDPSDQPRAGGDGHRVQVVEPDPGLAKGLGRHEVQPLGMGAGGDLRHDPAPLGVQRVLAPHRRGEDLAAGLAGAAAHQGGRGVVAAALDPEDDAGVLHPFLHVAPGAGRR